MRWLLLLLTVIGFGCAREGSLQQAIQRDDVAAAATALKRHPKAIHQADKFGNLPLHHAAMADSAIMVAMLLEAGAKPNPRNNQGETPLDVIGDNNPSAALPQTNTDPFGDPFAASEGATHDPFAPSPCYFCDASEPEECEGELATGLTCDPADAITWPLEAPPPPNNTVELLLEAYGAITGKQLEANFFDRVQNGDLGYVTKMLNANPSLIHATEREIKEGEMFGYLMFSERPDFGKLAPLTIAVDNRDTELIKLLIDYGAAVNETDTQGFTMPYRAIGAGNPAIARQLVEAGAPSSMHLEAMLGDTAAIQQRLAAGEDPNQTDWLYSRPLDWAIAFEHQEIIDLLTPLAIDKAMTAADYRAEAERIRLSIAEKGYPVTGAAMNAYYPTPEGENAATVVLQMFEDARKLEWDFDRQDDYDKIPLISATTVPFDRSKPLTGETYELTKEYLVTKQPILDGCRKIQKLSGARFPLDFEAMTAATLLPHLNRNRSASRTLHLQMAVALADGDHQEAFNAALDGLALASTLKNEPIIISQLVLNASRAITIGSLERLLSQTELDDEELQKLDKAIAKARANDGFLRSMVGELFSERSFYRDVTRRQFLILRIPISEPGYALFRKSRAFAYDEWLHAASSTRMIDVLERPEAQRRAALHSVAGWLEDARSPCSISLFRAIEDNLSGFPSMVSRNQLRGFVNVDTARVAIAIERYRHQHDNLPPDLHALVPGYLPELPLNLLGEGPLQWRRVNNGYDVFGDGPNPESEITFSVRKVSVTK